MAKISKVEMGIAFKHLRANTSISVVSTFLKRLDLTYSAGSWSSLIDNRIIPALESGTLDRSDVISLLRDAEEYGRQHILLFKMARSAAQQLMDEGHVKSALKRFNLEGLYESPRIVDLPSGHVLVDVRIDTGIRTRELVIKSVEGRVYRRLLSRKTEGAFETLVYENYHQRAVNVLRVQEDGSVEIRVQSHRRVVDYSQEAERMIELCIPLIDRLRLESVPLTTAKMYFARKPPELHGRARFGNGFFRNKKGGGMTVFTGSEQQDLYDDEGAIEGTAAYLKRNDGYCEEANIYWLPKVEKGHPSSELHTYVAGAVNEFALTAQCDRSDYEYVLGQIKTANRRR